MLFIISYSKVPMNKLSNGMGAVPIHVHIITRPIIIQQSIFFCFKRSWKSTNSFLEQTNLLYTNAILVIKYATLLTMSYILHNKDALCTIQQSLVLFIEKKEEKKWQQQSPHEKRLGLWFACFFCCIFCWNHFSVNVGYCRVKKDCVFNAFGVLEFCK